MYFQPDFSIITLGRAKRSPQFGPPAIVIRNPIPTIVRGVNNGVNTVAAPINQVVVTPFRRGVNAVVSPIRQVFTPVNQPAGFQTRRVVNNRRPIANGADSDPHGFFFDN